MAEGPNLVVNGTFPVDIGDWTAEGLGLRSFVWDSGGNGRCVMTGATIPVVSPGVSLTVYQSITVSALSDYQAKWDIQLTSNPNYSKLVGIGLTKDDFDHGSVSAGSTGIKTLDFTTGAETTIFMRMFLIFSDFQFGSNGSFNTDDITLKEQLSGIFTPRIVVL